MKKLFRLWLLSCCYLLTSFSVNASLLKDCTVNSVTLDAISSIADNTDTNLLSSSHDATSCVGTYWGQDDKQGWPWHWPTGYPDTNVGQLNDGLLNGEGNLFDGMEFIDSDDLQDLDGNGVATGPGWIHLGHVEISRWWNASTF